MSSYIYFTHNERICLQKILSEGKSLRKIVDSTVLSPAAPSKAALFCPHDERPNKQIITKARTREVNLSIKNQRSFHIPMA